jgi:hypothetical protein
MRRRRMDRPVYWLVPLNGLVGTERNTKIAALERGGDRARHSHETVVMISGSGLTNASTVEFGVRYESFLVS